MGPSSWTPLRDTLILDFGWVVSGPVVGAILAGLGAEVLKIEGRAKADSLRLRNAVVDRQINWDLADSAHTFHAINRGKRSFAVDIKADAGLEVVKRLISKSDALVENFAVGAMERMGLDDAVLERLNPRLVHISLTPAGREGRLSPLRSYAATTGSLGGLEGSVGYDADNVTGMPTFGLVDYAAGAHGAFALVAALASPRGQREYISIDASQMESTIVSLGAGFAAHSAGLATVPGNTNPLECPTGVYLCADGGFISIAVHNDVEWQRLTTILGIDELSHLDLTDRIRQRERIERTLATAIANQERDELDDALLSAGVDAAPVLTMGERQQHEFFRDRGSDTMVTMPNDRSVSVPATPWLVDGARAAPPGRKRAPRMGEDTDWVCREVLGMSESHIAALRNKGVIG